jgi:hypothetical protein
MAILAFREVLPRTFQQRFGESPTAERKFVVTLDEPTPTVQIINAVGILFGAQHPEFSYLRMLDGSVNETGRQHAEITYRYELPQQQDLDPNPLGRADVWSFSTGGAVVPALTYYDGTQVKPLVNTANEFFENLTTLEAEVRATIAFNRASFPASLAASVTNAINSDQFLWGPPHTWQCAGISASQQVEVVNDQEIRYWAGTTELVYRQSGWNLQIPNVGWNYLENNKLKRAWVEDPETNEKVPSGAPRALTQQGGLKADDQLPDILERRVFREASFNQFFGTPPF